MALGENLQCLDGYAFAVRYSDGALERATRAAGITARAYEYLSRLFSGCEPDIALIVADETEWANWTARCPYGLPFFSDDVGDFVPGVIVMPASSGDFWAAMVHDLRKASPRGYARLLTTYSNGAGGVDLQPFFDLITIHELGHAFEVLGDLRLPTFWLGEIFANLALHAFVASQLPQSLTTLEVLSTVGARSRNLAARMRSEGYSTLEELQAHYTGGDDAMDPLNYVWYQHRWQRLAAKMYAVDGENGLVRFWECFHEVDRRGTGETTAATLSPLLTTQVSATLGRAIREWR